MGVIFRNPVPGSQRIYTNGPFEMCQVRMFVKQRRTHGSYLLSKKLYAKAKIVKSLHDVFKLSKKFLGNYLCPLQ